MHYTFLITYMIVMVPFWLVAMHFAKKEAKERIVKQAAYKDKVMSKPHWRDKQFELPSVGSRILMMNKRMIDPPEFTSGLYDTLNPVEDPATWLDNFYNNIDPERITHWCYLSEIV